MIFSKDKKPTEPGWYWAFVDDDATVVQVADIAGVLMVFSTAFTGPYSLNAFLFGDRIQIPEAEVSAPDTKEGA